MRVSWIFRRKTTQAMERVAERIIAKREREREQEQEREERKEKTQREIRPASEERTVQGQARGERRESEMQWGRERQNCSSNNSHAREERERKKRERPTASATTTHTDSVIAYAPCSHSFFFLFFLQFSSPVSFRETRNRQSFGTNGYFGLSLLSLSLSLFLFLLGLPVSLTTFSTLGTGTPVTQWQWRLLCFLILFLSVSEIEFTTQTFFPLLFTFPHSLWSHSAWTNDSSLSLSLSLSSSFSLTLVLSIDLKAQDILGQSLLLLLLLCSPFVWERKGVREWEREREREMEKRKYHRRKLRMHCAWCQSSHPSLFSFLLFSRSECQLQFLGSIRLYDEQGKRKHRHGYTCHCLRHTWIQFASDWLDVQLNAASLVSSLLLFSLPKGEKSCLSLYFFFSLTHSLFLSFIPAM